MTSMVDRWKALVDANRPVPAGLVKRPASSSSCTGRGASPARKEKAA